MRCDSLLVDSQQLVRKLWRTFENHPKRRQGYPCSQEDSQHDACSQLFCYGHFVRPSICGRRSVTPLFSLQPVRADTKLPEPTGFESRAEPSHSGCSEHAAVMSRLILLIQRSSLVASLSILKASGRWFASSETRQSPIESKVTRLYC